jgi:hypothetical protein
MDYYDRLDGSRQLLAAIRIVWARLHVYAHNSRFVRLGQNELRANLPARFLYRQVCKTCFIGAEHAGVDALQTLPVYFMGCHDGQFSGTDDLGHPQGSLYDGKNHFVFYGSRHCAGFPDGCDFSSAELVHNLPDGIHFRQYSKRLEEILTVPHAQKKEPLSIRYGSTSEARKESLEIGSVSSFSEQTEIVSDVAPLKIRGIFLCECGIYRDNGISFAQNLCKNY